MSLICSSLCLQLGNEAAASKANADPTTQVVPVMSTEELASIRREGGFHPLTLEHLEIIVASSDLARLYNPMELANWVPFLLQESTVSVRVLGDASASDLQSVNTSFLLAGLACASERRESGGTRVLTAQRRSRAAVAAAPLKKTVSNAVRIQLDGGDDDMIDEDVLLSEGNDLLAPPPAMGERTAGDDCSGREPCDNCTCGRGEKQKENSSEPKEVKSSACGKCGLGDAFRCASCPYLGKPAFKPGEEHLVLELNDDL